MALLHHFPMQESAGSTLTDVVTGQTVTLAAAGFSYGVDSGGGPKLVVNNSANKPTCTGATFAVPYVQHAITFLAKFTAAADSEYRGVMSIHTDATDPLLLFLTATSGVATYGHLAIGRRGGVITRINLAAGLEVGRLYHFGLALDPGGSKYRLTIDGQPIATVAASADFGSVPNTSLLFSDAGNSGAMRGGLAQLRLWSTALSDAELLSAYQQDIAITSIEGIARLANNDPVNEVVCVNLADDNVYRGVPDGAGAYSIPVPPGTYLVVADGPAGYRPQAHKVVVS